MPRRAQAERFVHCLVSAPLNALRAASSQLVRVHTRKCVELRRQSFLSALRQPYEVLNGSQIWVQTHSNFSASFSAFSGAFWIVQPRQVEAQFRAHFGPCNHSKTTARPQHFYVPGLPPHRASQRAKTAHIVCTRYVTQREPCTSKRGFDLLVGTYGGACPPGVGIGGACGGQRSSVRNQCKAVRGSMREHSERTGAQRLTGGGRTAVRSAAQRSERQGDLTTGGSGRRKRWIDVRGASRWRATRGGAGDTVPLLLGRRGVRGPGGGLRSGCWWSARMQEVVGRLASIRASLGLALGAGGRSEAEAIAADVGVSARGLEDLTADCPQLGASARRRSGRQGLASAIFWWPGRTSAQGRCC